MNLGLTPGRNEMPSEAFHITEVSEDAFRAMVARFEDAANEVQFRQGIMAQLLERKVAGPLRRQLLERAVREYREKHQAARPLQTRKLSMQGVLSKGGVGPDAHLRSAVRRMLEEAGEKGVHAHKLAQFVRSHGCSKLTAVLQSLNVYSHNHMIFLKKYDGKAENVANLSRAYASDTLSQLEKAEAEVLPRGGSGSGGGSDDRSEPIGARKVWNKRIVEKKADGKWHVVGHIAGLEDPGKVPQLDLTTISREALLHLLQQLIRVHQAHNGKP